jgi:hypothetical protein
VATVSNRGRDYCVGLVEQYQRNSQTEAEITV